ncbi:MAG TPA: hypothetical protein VGF28_02980 [Thermoanaerobaculia bacterium]|jgi:hypothetical protein
MKTIALTAMLLLLLSACASGDGFVANELDTCQAGDELELQAGIAEASMFADGRATVLVEVSNNSSADVTVTVVRVDPASPDQQRIEVMGGAVTTPHDIKEGESHTFEVPITIRLKDQMNAPRQRGYTIAVDTGVSVQTSSGISSRCRFRLPVSF